MLEASVTCPRCEDSFDKVFADEEDSAEINMECPYCFAELSLSYKINIEVTDLSVVHEGPYKHCERCGELEYKDRISEDPEGFCGDCRNEVDIEELEGAED